MKDTDQFWKKVQSDLAIPKEQVELLRQSEGDTIEQKLVDFVSKYSQSIEINTAKGFNGDVSNKWFYNEVEPNRFIIYSPDGEPETEFDNIKDTESFIKNKSGENVPNTQHYSNLTVPGGTNYTENEISTPGITPSIKGHAQFSTDNGIGWFRSDVATEDNSIYTESSYQENFTPTKTRRILEVQSDLFQKGRDRNRLVDIINTKIVYTASIFQNEEFNFTLNGDYYESIVKMVYYEEKNQSEPTERYYKNGQRISSKEITIAKEEYIKLKGDLNNENQFLQLLNKNNNWVTFFVKSIIQDSAKKGYEKVLFPLGETIAKIEQYGEAAKIYAKLLAKKPLIIKPINAPNLVNIDSSDNKVALFLESIRLFI